MTATNGVKTAQISSNSSLSTGVCAGHGISENATISNWNVSGTGLSYDASDDSFIASASSTGMRSSPLIDVDGASSIKIRVDSYATMPWPNGSPHSRVYYGTYYYQADGTTPATNTYGYTSNGNAACRCIIRGLLAHGMFQLAQMLKR